MHLTLLLVPFVLLGQVKPTAVPSAASLQAECKAVVERVSRRGDICLQTLDPRKPRAPGGDVKRDTLACLVQVFQDAGMEPVANGRLAKNECSRELGETDAKYKAVLEQRTAADKGTPYTPPPALTPKPGPAPLPAPAPTPVPKPMAAPAPTPTPKPTAAPAPTPPAAPKPRTPELEAACKVVLDRVSGGADICLTGKRVVWPNRPPPPPEKEWRLKCVTDRFAAAAIAPVPGGRLAQDECKPELRDTELRYIALVEVNSAAPKPAPTPAPLPPAPTTATPTPKPTAAPAPTPKPAPAPPPPAPKPPPPPAPKPPSGPSASLVYVEIDPAPPNPSAFCTPVRVRSENQMPVTVTLNETFSNADGPGCQGGSSTTRSVSLAARGGASAGQYLGCAKLRTPNMTCSENRSWSVVGVR